MTFRPARHALLRLTEVDRSRISDRLPEDIS